MSNSPKWLRRYYGDEFKDLSPVVEIDGKTHAIVRIGRMGKVSHGFHRFGYVLIKKSGTHNVSTQLSVHEGVMDAKAKEKARKKLEEIEAG